jgi:hypothetical protein
MRGNTRVLKGTRNRRRLSSKWIHRSPEGNGASAAFRRPRTLRNRDLRCSSWLLHSPYGPCLPRI